MANIVFSDLREEMKRKAKARKLRIPSKRVRREGRSETIYTFDLASSNFGLEFGAVFQRSVTRARRENKRLIGSPDIEPAE